MNIGGAGHNSRSESAHPAFPPIVTPIEIGELAVPDLSLEETAVAAINALSARDIDRFQSLLHNDIVYVVTGRHPFSQKISGATAILSLFAQVGAAFEDSGPRYRIDRVLPSASSVVVMLNGTGTLKNGKKYDNDYCMIFDFSDRKIIGISEYFDSHHVMQAMA
ncbi:nuclear transport factor 2 family protein [Caenibius tardaugens]|uniref:nuclear transport factor 2 family protein n=1 Tax=Caenibius tardaugens TaxID=169176 RepID=UPI0013763061|nr:nuclear transport factor 2 family protein [Caenibius tardaugens]